MAGRFRDKDAALRKKIEQTGPASFKATVDMKKVDRGSVLGWAERRLRSLLGVEDFLVEGLVRAFVELDKPNPVELQMQLHGFLEAEAAGFVEALWNLMLESQASPSGVPLSILQGQKAQIRAFLPSSALAPHSTLPPPPTTTSTTTTTTSFQLALEKVKMAAKAAGNSSSSTTTTTEPPPKDSTTPQPHPPHPPHPPSPLPTGEPGTAHRRRKRRWGQEVVRHVRADEDRGGGGGGEGGGEG